MKFISSFIKHSLLPSRQASTVFSQTNLTNRTQPAFSSNEGLKKPINFETKATQTLTDSSSFPDAISTPFNNDIDSSIQQIPKDKLDAAEIREPSINTSPENKTPNVSNSVQSTESLQQVETEFSDSIASPKNNIISNSDFIDYPDNIQQEANRSNNKLTASNSSVTSNTQDFTLDNPADKTLPITPEQTEGFESQQQSIQSEFSSMPLQAELSAEEQQKSSTLTIQQTDTDSNEAEPPVAVAVNRQTKPITLKQETFLSPQSREQNSSKPVETPQVRIGNINILIDDQAAAKPVTKTASSNTPPSMPFGLRGL